MTDREQFEAWAKEFSPSTPLWTDNQGQYVYWFSEWVAWQAARAQSSTSNQLQVGTTVQALGDAAVSELWVHACRDHITTDAVVRAFARLVERHHGIEQAVLAKRVPMTDAQIEHALRLEPMVDNEESFALGIRHAERRHGIVGEKGGA